MFAVGIRRNLSNIAAADFGATVLQAISHQRVCRCEVRTGAAILARMRHQCSRAKAADSTPWALTVVSFRCDATNSSIWRREKLHVLDVDLAWVKDHEAAKAFNARGAFECHRFEGSSTGGRCAERPVQAGLWGRRMSSPEASDQSGSETSSFEAVSSHLHRLQWDHSILESSHRVLADRVSLLEDEVRAGQARLTWLERFVQRLRTLFTSFQ
eukprot:s1014_g4.t1